MMKMHVIASGSKGNASVIYNERCAILIDDGISLKRLNEGLHEINKTLNDINFVLVTHDHSDHIAGLKYILNKEIYCLLGVYKTKAKRYIELFEEYDFKDFKVTPIMTSHDATASCGFIFSEGEESLVYLTDSGMIPESTLKKINNADYYFIESNHDLEMLYNSDRPQILKDRIHGDFGHLSNEQCGEYLSMLIGPNTKKICLAHLSEECNSPEIARNTVSNIINNMGISFDFNNLICAKQYESVDVL